MEHQSRAQEDRKILEEALQRGKEEALLLAKEWRVASLFKLLFVLGATFATNLGGKGYDFLLELWWWLIFFITCPL
jgi:hypothetical protein